jgi:hypothetical protein
MIIPEGYEGRTEPRAVPAVKVSGSGLPRVRPRLDCTAALSSSSAAV